MNRFLFLIVSLFLHGQARSQFSIGGTVFDISKVNYVENVRVVSTGGMFTITDSMGRYQILVNKSDSLIFYYNNKPTMKFPVATVEDPRHFNISLSIPVKGKYSLMKEVTVFAKSYREDSLENRQTYASVFSYAKPGLQSSLSSDGLAGADLDQLINVFRFRYNKRMRKFRERLEAEEQEKFINYRFNKTFVRRITGLQSPALDTFLVWYRPDYAFTRDSDEISFNQYVLSASYQFRKIYPVPGPAKKNEP
ncbi:MAG: hypothetical protein U0T56_07315 [Ferruginibacter sp.]